MEVQDLQILKNTSGRAPYQKCQALRILMEDILWTDFGIVSQHGISEDMLLQAVHSLRSNGQHTGWNQM